MADAQFPWDELLDLITTEQRTVPILGPELSVLSTAGGACFEEHAAQTLASRHGLQLGKATTFPQLAPTLLGPDCTKVQLSHELATLHRELLATLPPQALPEPLRLIADIRDFPLLVTTATDTLLNASLKAVRERETASIVASLGSSTDLPRNWAQGPRPLIFQLFGRINSIPDFALTEEDLVEFLHRLQSEAHRPEQLFDELRSHHLLLIGVRMPDWALRFFLRILRGTRLSEDTGQTITIAGDGASRDSALAGYLRETGRRVWLYEGGSAVEFVRELHQRWHASQEEGWSTTADTRVVPAEPMEMAPGAVFISAARGDRVAAERLAAVLDEAGLDVWFDGNEQREGVRYERRLRQHVQQCDLFIPLFSPETETASDPLQVQEWQWAAERDLANEIPGRRFVLPVWVGSDPAVLPPPPPFKRLAYETAPGGLPSTDFVAACVAAVRRERASRNL